MIKMVSVLGPAIYDYINGFDVTVGALEEIKVSSGKMVVVQANSSCEFLIRADIVSGNIVTIKAFDPANASSGFAALTTSADLSAVEVAVIVDGY